MWASSYVVLHFSSVLGARESNLEAKIAKFMGLTTIACNLEERKNLKENRFSKNNQGKKKEKFKKS